MAEDQGGAVGLEEAGGGGRGVSESDPIGSGLVSSRKSRSRSW